MAEIAFQRLLVALEATAGTPVNPPTRYLNMVGTVTPRKARYRPDESRGVLAEYFRSADMRKWSEWEAEGPLDVYTLPLLLNTLVAGGIDGSGATDAEMTTSLTGANNDIVWTAVDGGPQGNAISIQYINPAANSSPLDVDVAGSGKAIKIYLATDVGGAITSTADDLKAAVAAHPVASLLVAGVDAGGDDGSGVVTAMAATYLTGGAGADVTQPPSAVLSHIWTFIPTMNADDLQAMTLYWGDPNVQAFQAAYCMPDEVTVTADASGTDGVTLSLSGQGQFPAKTAPSSDPAMLAAPMLLPTAMQLWIDAVTIGTTPVTGRVVSAEVTLPSGVTRKWLAAGPTSTLGFSAVGRGKRHMEMKLVLELPDMTQYDQWEAGTSLKTRLRLNGPAIETVAGPLTYYHYSEFDIYGPVDGLDWGENEGSNRTVELTILSEYDTTAEYDWCWRVQTDRNAL